MTFLNTANSLYILLLQNLCDIMINLGASKVFNNTENYSWRTAEYRWRHDLFLFSVNIFKKKLKLTSKGLSESCNYALAKDSDKSKWLHILNKIPERILVTHTREIWATPSILRVQRSLSLNLQPGSKVGYNLGKTKKMACSLSILTPTCLVRKPLHLGEGTTESTQTEGKSWPAETMWVLRRGGPSLSPYQDSTCRNDRTPECGGRKWAKVWTELSCICLFRRFKNIVRTNEWVDKGSKKKLNK